MDKLYTVSKPRHKMFAWSVVDDYTFALGELCMAWSALDHTLQETFQWMLGVDDAMAAIVASGLDSAEARATPIKKLLVLNEFKPAHAEFINSLLKRITNEIGPARNRHIHDRWWLTHGGMKRVDRRASLKKSQSRQDVTLEFNSAQVVKVPEIERLTQYARTVDCALWHLNIDLSIWRETGRRPRHDARWNPACKAQTRLLRYQSSTMAPQEWPQASDFHTD